MLPVRLLCRRQSDCLVKADSESQRCSGREQDLDSPLPLPILQGLFAFSRISPTPGLLFGSHHPFRSFVRPSPQTQLVHPNLDHAIKENCMHCPALER